MNYILHFIYFQKNEYQLDEIKLYCFAVQPVTRSYLLFTGLFSTSMFPSPIAHAMRLWQDMLGQEHETPRSFLWQNVEDIEPDEAGAINWRNQQVKTRIYFKGDKVICVLGDYSSWRRQWEAFAKWHEVPLKQLRPN